MEGISVIICTFNGASRLENTLAHLVNQKTAGLFPWEVIVVDNGSSDGTSTFAGSYWEMNAPRAIRMTILIEELLGKYYALQRGISHARFPYFIICDDDNWLADDYLLTAFNILKYNPSIGAVGGYATSTTNARNGFPYWFAKFSEGYAVGAQRKGSGYLAANDHLWGAGLASRTQLYRSVYNKWPSLLLRAKVKQIMSTEDTEYSYRLTLAGHRLYYDEKLRLAHFIPKEKLTEAYQKSLYDNFSKSQRILAQYQMAIKIKAWHQGGKGNKKIHRFLAKLQCYLKLIFYKKQKNIYRQHLLLAWLKEREGNGPHVWIEEILENTSTVLDERTAC